MPALLTDPDVVRAGESVLKIRGANECGKGVEGTGFVIGRGYLMTNAHVVAGVDDPNVIVGNRANDAKVVHYDPEIDIAVLKFKGGANLKRLEFDRTAAAEDPIAVLGYPQDGPFDVQPGRIRAEQRLRSPDIYGVGTVIRDVYSVRSLIRPGNSGGPIVDSEGDVVGVVFAASVTDSETGYALTADQVIDIAREARSQTAAVDTGACAS
jgi:S1-C subfamily serine protease